MTGEASATSTLNPPRTKASVLITISTPEAATPICRLSDSEDVVRGLTVRELIQRVISPNSLFSVGVPISQLQSESPTALAIGELLSADCCRVVAPGKGTASHQDISLDEQARSVAREQVGTQGNRFLNVNLEVRSAPDAAAPLGDDRRRSYAPLTEEVEPKRPVLMAGVIEPSPSASSVAAEQPAGKRPAEKASSAPFWTTRADHPSTAPEAPRSEFKSEPAPKETEPAAREAEAPVLHGIPAAAGRAPVSLAEESRKVAPGAAPVEAPESKTSAETAPAELASEPTASPAGGTSTGSILAIVADRLEEEPKGEKRERKDYARKSDWLRAQFLPEVEALDFSGLFVGNLGFGIRQEKTRRNVVLADPARITEVLLRANGYRRNGDHAKALICYQELIDMDASNADFRFLLGKTLMALGQRDQALEAFSRAKELGHEGAEKELGELKRSGHRPKAALGFLRFWK
ncbi:MAG TPA: tetratricopeptide repeat protein [Armatimonadota bacterium]|nr:tetratricopeptide repeat protein [Armatimonadota bacterium]